MNRRIEVTNFEPETIFDKNIDEIKAGHTKTINSLDMNILDITSNKPSLFSEHLNKDLMPWIVIQSTVESPQFSKNVSSMHLKGNTQLKKSKIVGCS